jgi:hypothetical protein
MSADDIHDMASGPEEDDDRIGLVLAYDLPRRQVERMIALVQHDAYRCDAAPVVLRSVGRIGTGKYVSICESCPGVRPLVWANHSQALAYADGHLAMVGHQVSMNAQYEADQ